MRNGLSHPLRTCGRARAATVRRCHCLLFIYIIISFLFATFSVVNTLCTHV